LSAFFGLAADYDDDGNAAEDKGNKVEGSERKHKPRPAPQIEAPPVNEEEMVPTLVKIVRFANEKGIPNEEMKTIIKRVTGTDKKSTELNPEELESLWKYLNMSKS